MTDLALRPEVAVQLTPHAWARLKEMGLRLDDVMVALAEPEFDRPDQWDPTRRKAKREKVEVLYSVEGDQRIVITVLWSGEASGYERWEQRDDPQSRADTALERLLEPVPEPSPVEGSSAMNGIFLSQLALWGCTEGRRNADWVHVRTPGGTLIKVRPAGHRSETKAEVADRAYELLGVTPEQFWSRTTKVRGPRERLFAPRPVRTPRPVEPVTQLFEQREPVTSTVTKRKRGRGRPRGAATEAVLDFFESRPTAVLGLRDLAEQLGIDQEACRRSVAGLSRSGRLLRLGRNRYQLASTAGSESERRLAQINSELASTTDLLRRMDLIEERLGLLTEMSPSGADPPVPEGERFVADGHSDEIDVLLELLAPDGVPHRHVDAAERWRNATKAFIEELRS